MNKKKNFWDNDSIKIENSVAEIPKGFKITMYGRPITELRQYPDEFLVCSNGYRILGFCGYAYSDRVKHVCDLCHTNIVIEYFEEELIYDCSDNEINCTNPRACENCIEEMLDSEFNLMMYADEIGCPRINCMNYRENYRSNKCLKCCYYVESAEDCYFEEKREFKDSDYAIIQDRLTYINEEEEEEEEEK